jgi:phage terminase large subunit GpA-like protein
VITDGAEPGAFHPYPYQPGIMDAMSDPAAQFVTVKKSKRVGYTQIITFAQGYFIHQDPSSMVVVQPTIDDAKEYSKDTIQPMLEETPVLQGLVSEAKSRDSKNTMMHKQYPGGALHMRGANSMRGFRRLTTRVGIGDEVDAWPVLPGGDQVKALVGRTETYGPRRKIILGSTPLHEGTSKIDRSYQRSDQRIYKVPCPECDALQPITWSRIRWPEGEPEKAFMECSECKAAIPHSKKAEMLEAGFKHGDMGWHVQNPEVCDHKGFWIWAGYSMNANASWGQLAKEFLEVKDNPEELQTFTNEVLAETWELQGDAPEPDKLHRTLRSSYGVIPQQACLVTAGVDVQKDRLEIEVVAWDREGQSWSLAYDRIYGDPSAKDVWRELDAYLVRTYEHESGHLLPVHACAVDTGSNLYTESIYRYCAKRWGRRIYAIKGQGGQGLPAIVRDWMHTKYRVRLFTLGVDTLKTTLFARLNLGKPGPGFCNFPMDRDLDYFLGLGSEKAVRKMSKGQQSIMYVHDKRIPNEPIDCRVYAMGALRILNPSWDAWEQAVSRDDAPAPEPSGPRPMSQRPRRKTQSGNWVTSW